jgi:hypothetical protein
MTAPSPIMLIEALSNGSVCIADTKVATFVQLAELRVGATFCPDKRNYLVAYLALHMYTMGSRNGDSGFITGRTEGDLSIRYNDNQTTLTQGDSLDTTTYGKLYKELCRECVGTAIGNAYE